MLGLSAFFAPDRGCPAQFATGRNTVTSVEFVVAELVIGLADQIAHVRVIVVAKCL